MKIDAELFDICKEFIKENQITCAEAIYQRDSLVVKSQELLEQICDLLGYYEEEEDLEWEEDSDDE